MQSPPNVWDAIFRDRGHVFAEPHEERPAIARTLHERGGRTLLDLGSGTGRHVVYFARQDSPPSGSTWPRQGSGAPGSGWRPRG